MDDDDRALWRALQPLRSAATWLMIGAHPDDEWNGFLAWLAYGHGVHTVYGCSTRGEGGQNALGPERGRALGVLRSREMERAAGEIGLAVRWLGAGPARGDDDPIHDFGFSRSGVDTLRRWGEARLVGRLAALIRTERPDAVSPTFLDVPGQHGHHRAMTAATRRAIAVAADPAFPSSGPGGWHVAQFYLPAFSGAGASYDDTEPPPPETVRVDLGEHCAALGASWAQLGERSRRFHASQGMGRDLPDGPRPFALHLASGVADRDLPMDGVAHSLQERAGTLAAGPAARALRDAGEAIGEAGAAFPDRRRVAASLQRALGLLAGEEWPDSDLERRVALKRRQLGRAMALALGAGATLDMPGELRAGETFSVAVRPAAARLRVPDGWHVTEAGEGRYRVAIPTEAAPFGTQRDGFDPLGGNDMVGAILVPARGASIEVDPPERLSLAPAVEVEVSPHLLARRTDSATPATLALTGAHPPGTWPARVIDGGRVEILAPEGRLDLPPAGARLARFASPMAGPLAFVEQARASLLRLPLAIPHDARVGVVAGATDEALGWLRQMDVAAEALDDATLAEGDFGRFTTVLVGIFGFGQRPALRANRDRLMAWVRAGGSLVTLYHRPEDGWDAGRTPPLHLLPGRPSLRWRVADPAAEVRVLAPRHPLLNVPNAIGREDWEGWVRERGLYFACEWDPAYVPLLELGDPGETKLRGALLAAPVGRGRHVHVALALHHQMTALVPGAFRILANLVAAVG